MPSQFGQDRLILELLGGLRGGFFLDSGASDGVRSSNTYLLETAFDWDGICVEPNDAFFAALEQNRECRCFHCCLYDRDGDVDFLEASTLGGIIDEYHPKLLRHATRVMRLRLDAYGAPMTVRKPTRTIRSVLQAGNAPPVIDYWSLDTEGSELAILKSFPWDEYTCRVLTVEHNNLPPREDIRRYLTGRRYQLAGEIGVDDCYVLAGSLGTPAWRSSAWRR